jgi:hypothetical protein
MAEKGSKNDGLATRDQVLFGPIKDLEAVDALQAWAFLDFVEKQIKDRKAEVRGVLMESAEEDGRTNQKGSFVLKTGMGKVIREKRQAKAHDEKALLKLLKDKNIPVLEGFDEVKSLKANPSKVEHLVSIGKLSREDADGCKKAATWALKVEPGQLVNARLVQAANRYYSGNKGLLGGGDDR